LTRCVRAVKPTSSVSATAAPTTVAMMTPSTPSTAETIAAAANPVPAPIIARIAVYVGHFKYGGRRSPNWELAATIIAARGPNRTAASRVGRSPIEPSMVLLRRTLPRSAAIDIAGRPPTAQMFGRFSVAARGVPSPTAKRHRPATYVSRALSGGTRQGGASLQNPLNSPPKRFITAIAVSPLEG